MFRTSEITVNLHHQRADRKRFYANHTQSFVLCDHVEGGSVGHRTAIICSRRTGYTYWTGMLHSGSYVLIPFSASYWNRPKENNNETNFTLVVHSIIQVDLVIVEESANILANCLIAAVMKNCRTPRKVGRVITSTGN